LRARRSTFPPFLFCAPDVLLNAGERQGMERRKQSRKRTQAAGAVHLSFIDDEGLTQDIEACAADTSDEGLGIVVSVCLRAGLSVAVRGSLRFGKRRETAHCRAVVRWCTPKEGGGYRAGLALVPVPDIEALPELAEDYYDLLQVSAKADPDTIHRVFRIMAQRYHPDNADTGNAEMFRTVTAAYRVLSDPEQRAAYDVRRKSFHDVRRRIFDDANSSCGIEAEKRKRAGLLSVLYTRRVHNCEQPAMSLREMEDLLGCPKEHLEFSLWYLKERGFVIRADNARFAITAAGVEEAEKAVATPIRPTQGAPRALTAGAPAERVPFV
jgi:hypothetical protein